MAKINESIIVVKVSKLVKDSDTSRPALDADALAQLEEVIKTLADEGSLVEIETMDNNG
jgi:hypothetical protein